MATLETYAQQDGGLLCGPGEMTPELMQQFGQYYTGDGSSLLFPEKVKYAISVKAEAGSVTARNMLHLLGIEQCYPDGSFEYAPAHIIVDPPYDRAAIFNTRTRDVNES